MALSFELSGTTPENGSRTRGAASEPKFRSQKFRILRILAAIALHHAPIMGSPVYCHIMFTNRRSPAAAPCCAGMKPPPAL
jgi:hypothetical protein